MSWFTFYKGQDIENLSLSQAFEVAKQNNAKVMISKIDEEKSKAEYKKMDAIFLPQVSLGYTAMATNNPLNAFGFLLQQETVTAMDFDPNKLNDPGNSMDFMLKAEVKQPLLNLDMLYARKARGKQQEIYQHQTQRTEDYILFEVEKAYLQLQYSYLSQEILKSSLEDVQNIYKLVNNFYQQGLIQKSDVLNAKVQVNTIETLLQKTKSSVLNSQDQLKLQMGVENEATFEVEPFSQYATLAKEEDLSMNRSDIMAMNKMIEASDIMIKSSKMSFLPKLNAFASYQLNDSNLFGFNANSYLAGISLQWNIFSGNQIKNDIKIQNIEKSKREEELALMVKESRLEINKTKRNIQDLESEIEKQKASLEHAQEAFRITENRYKAGLVSTRDLLVAQSTVSEKKVLLAQTQLGYNITQAYLNFLLTK